MQMSFAELDILSRLTEDRVLSKIDRLLDWQAVRGRLKGLYKRQTEDKGSQQPYDSLVMFKAVLLDQWYSLSDAELEQALRVRLDFIAFTHLPLVQLPDATTFCRFRNRLIKADKLGLLLDEINRQLQGVQKAERALLDATLITSAARPNRHITVATDAGQQPETYEDGSQPGCVEESQSAAPDASWVKKGKKRYFGYRSYAVTDEEGYFFGAHTALAHESEMNHFIPALEAAKNRPLSDRQKAANKLIATGWSRISASSSANLALPERVISARIKSVRKCCLRACVPTC